MKTRSSGEVDTVLANNLSEIIALYVDAFELVKAAEAEKDDHEIVSLVFNQLKTNVADANSRWDAGAIGRHQLIERARKLRFADLEYILIQAIYSAILTLLIGFIIDRRTLLATEEWIVGRHRIAIIALAVIILCRFGRGFLFFVERYGAHAAGRRSKIRGDRKYFDGRSDI